MVYFNDVVDGVTDLNSHQGFRVQIVRDPEKAGTDDEYTIYSQGLAGPTKESLYEKGSSVVVVVEVDNKDRELGPGEPSDPNNPNDPGDPGESNDPGEDDDPNNPNDPNDPDDNDDPDNNDDQTTMMTRQQ